MLPSLSGVCQRWGPLRATLAHTALVDLPEVGSQYPVGVALRDPGGARALRCGLQAGWPSGSALAAVVVDSVPGLPGPGLCRLNRATGGFAQQKYIHACTLVQAVHVTFLMR